MFKKNYQGAHCVILRGVRGRVRGLELRIWRSGVHTTPAALFPWQETLVHFLSLHPGV